MLKTNVLKVVGMGVAIVWGSVAQGQTSPCKDPWINQAFQQIYRRAPIGSGTTGECDITRYGNGHWTSYDDLKLKIVQHGTGTHAMPTAETPAPSPNAALIKRLGPNDLGVTPTGDLINNTGAIVLKQGTYLISQDGGNVKAGASGSIIGENSSGLLTDNGAAMQVRAGDLIQDGAAFLKGYSVQSVGGKKVVKGTVVHQ